MPIYVYQRPDGSRFEIRQGFNDSSLTEDPDTGVPVHRVMQAPPVIFKGSGWYKTDSRPAANNASTAGEPAKTDATTDAADATAKSETPAAKTETTTTSTETKSDAKPEAKSSEKTPAKPTPAAAS